MSPAACMQGDNLFQLLGPSWAPDASAYMLLAAAAMVPTVWLPDQKSLSYLGFLGITATMTVTGAVAYTLLTGKSCVCHFRHLGHGCLGSLHSLGY